MGISRTQIALNEFISSVNYHNLVVETYGPKKVRAPNVQQALEPVKPHKYPHDYGMGERVNRRMWGDPPEQRPRPDPGAIKAAQERESPGPSPTVIAFKKRQARESQLQSRKERTVRRATSRERRLKAKGLPQDFSLAPKRSAPETPKV